MCAYYTRPLPAEFTYAPLAEIAASSDEIPLKTENWAARWCTLPQHFEDVIESILDLEVRSGDVFLVTFMKCGTTWMQETAWMLMNNLDYGVATNTGLLDRSAFIDFSGLFKLAKVGDTIKKCNEMCSPRLIKSHLPANLLPHQLWQKKQKTIYVARNVKDVVVSSFHFTKGSSIWFGNLDEYVEYFMNNKIIYTSFWAHVIDFWKMRNEPFIFFVTYEEMKRNLPDVIQRLCTFLERPKLNEKELEQLVQHLSFENMKNNETVNLTALLKDVFAEKIHAKFQFMRRGIVGSYKDELTPEQQSKLNKWSAEQLAIHGIKEEDIFGEV